MFQFKAFITAWFECQTRKLESLLLRPYGCSFLGVCSSPRDDKMLGPGDEAWIGVLGVT